MSGDDNSSLDSWAAEFNDNESLSDHGWSDDDDTSNEGSFMSEDSAVVGQNKPDSGPLSHAEAHHADHGSSKKKLKKNKYSSDPLAYRIGVIKQSSKMTAATADNDEEEEEESALKSSAGANCADTDVFKMLVEMLLGSPSELFAMSAEHIAPLGDLPSFLACLDNKRPFFQCTGLVDELHSMHMGGQSLAHFLCWFIDAATEAELCKRFVSLDTADIAGAVGSDPNSNINPNLDIQTLINTFKISVCKVSAHFEADVVRLEVEHNDIVRVRANTTATAADTATALKKGEGKENDDDDDAAANDVDFYASLGNRGVAPPDPYAAASAAFNRQWRGGGGGGGGDDVAAAANCGNGTGSLPFLGRGSNYQMSRSLLSLYTLCERWLPVLRSCSEFVKSLMMLVQELEVATGSYTVEGAYDDLALLCLGLVQAADETIRSFQLELGDDHHESAAAAAAAAAAAGGGGADVMMSGSSGSGGRGGQQLLLQERESKMQLRLRELHRSMGPSAWLAVTVQEDLFPAVLGYFIAVCEMARISNSHHMGSSSGSGSASRAQQQGNNRPAMHAIEYPTMHTFSGLRAPLQADLAALHKSLRQRQRQPVQSSDTTEQQQQHHDDGDDDNAKWSSHSSLYEQKKERRGDGGSDFQSLRRRRQASWQRAVATYQVPTQQPQTQTHRTQTKSQENDGDVSVSQASSRGKYPPLCLPAMSLLQVTVLHHHLRQARAAEVRDMQQLWSRLRLHHRFDLMQTVYFLGDESLFAGVKDVVESVFDVDTRSLSAALSPHSTGNNNNNSSSSSSSPRGTGRELDYRMLVRRQLVKPHTTRSLKLHLASAIEDKLRTFVNARAAAMSRGGGGGGSSSNSSSNTGDVEEELHLSVTSDLAALEEDERHLASSASSSFDGEGEARALMRMSSYLSVRVHCTRPLSLVLSESLCLCYESILSFLLSLSTCKWVCERVRLASKASILASPRAYDGVSPALIAGNSFKKDCHVTLGLLLHVLGAVKASLQVQAHQVGDYRNYASRQVGANPNKEDVAVVSLSLEELQRSSLYMMQEMVKVFARLQPALIALTNAAASFCDRFVSLLRAEAGVEGQAAFDMESPPCMHLQGQLLAVRDAMTQFVRRLDALLVAEPVSASGATVTNAAAAAARHAEASNNTCLLQLRNKLRTLFQ